MPIWEAVSIGIPPIRSILDSSKLNNFDYDKARYNLFENRFLDLLKLEEEYKIKATTLQKRLKLKSAEFSKIIAKLKRHNLISVKYEIENEKQKAKTKTVYRINENFDVAIKITKRHKEILEQMR